VDRLTLTAGSVVAATGGRLIHGRPEQAIDEISMDSRSLSA
jgi:hypothetical protein